MDIGIIQNQKVINACVFDDLQTAQDFLALGVWPDAESIVELPDGYGIGDGYDGTAWTKPPAPEIPEEPVITTPTLGEQVDALKADNAKQAATIKVLTTSTQTLEDCIVEMAGVVYA